MTEKKCKGHENIGKTLNNEFLFLFYQHALIERRIFFYTKYLVIQKSPIVRRIYYKFLFFS